MTLNKRTGLYSIPNHHLHGAQPASRPMFNSMDFAAEGNSSPSTEVESDPQVKKGKSATSTQVHEEKKKKHFMSIEDTPAISGHDQTISTPLITVTPATTSTKGRKDKNAANTDKKRKRKSGDDIEDTPKSSGDGGLFVSADMVQKVQSSVKAAGEVFSSRRAGEDDAEQRSKKKSKKDKAARNSTDTVDFDRIAKETRAIDKKARRGKKLKRRTAEAEAKAHSPVAGAAPVPSSPIFPSPPRKTPVPLPSIAAMLTKSNFMDVERVARPHKSKKARRSKQHSDEGDPTPVDISSPPHPRKTPVPLPQNAFSHAANATKADRIGRRDSRLFVLDTPPSELPKTPVNLPDSPIPFKLTDVIKAKERTESNKVADPSPPTRTAVEPSFSAPPALNKIPKLELKPDGRASLTTSNLQKYTTTTEPLSDQPKARPKTKSLAASTADSTTSGGTTPSIAALFERVGKPYSRSGAEHDPFVTTSSQNKKKAKSHLETHEEANLTTFTTLYLPAQHAINFTDEAAYLSSAHTWRSANHLCSPLPCLGQKASGCNPKRETILRLTRDDATSQLTVRGASSNDLATLERAKQGAESAEKFLAMSIRARVPVPLGVVEGTWRLFCPRYGERHVDRYGYGQRVLRIFSVPGFTSSTTTTTAATSTISSSSTVDVDPSYTARLSIPPRSMLYPLLPFCTPPHASFRPTTLKTSAEGYKLDVVFLGNGYLLLRVDLKLLLSGEAGTVMEFLGVHEGAVGWEGGEEEEEELEREGRRLCEKYDGVA